MKTETLIVGAGVIGSSVAFHLAQLGMNDVVVIDLDLEGSLSSSELNAGGVRGTWVQPINRELSQGTIQYFETHAEEVGYRACGYLWLYPEEKFKKALEIREAQIKGGWPVEVWDTNELRRRVPFIDKTEGIAGATFGPRDGLVNPNLLKNHYRKMAREKGVRFEDRTLLRRVEYSTDASHPVSAIAEKVSPHLDSDDKIQIMSRNPGDPGQSDATRQQITISAKRIINCAGPWANQVAALMGYQSPSYPLRRQVCIFDCRGVDLTPYGMIIDPSGVYFHPEASNGLAGYATPNEPKGVNFQYDPEDFFMNTIWPALYERSSAFEELKHVTGWAGLYEVSPDECGILGKVEGHGGVPNERVFEAHSLSGHGVMQSFTLGRALAERIVTGRYQTIDASPLSGTRFETGRLLHENWVI